MKDLQNSNRTRPAESTDEFVALVGRGRWLTNHQSGPNSFAWFTLWWPFLFGAAAWSDGVATTRSETRLTISDETTDVEANVGSDQLKKAVRPRTPRANSAAFMRTPNVENGLRGKNI